MEVEMKIRGLMMDPVTNMPIVVLKDVQGQAILPIWVGVYEANAIALEIEKVQTPRPMTHDLLKNVLLGLEVRVQKIVVNDLKDDTFYALIWVEREGQMMTIDSRPSDALALALRMDCPIYVVNWCPRILKCRARSQRKIPTSNCETGWKGYPTRTWAAGIRCNLQKGSSRVAFIQLMSKNPDWLPQVREFCRDHGIKIMAWGADTLVVQAKSPEIASQI